MLGSGSLLGQTRKSLPQYPVKSALFINPKLWPYLVDKVICQLLHATLLILKQLANRPYMAFVVSLQNKIKRNIIRYNETKPRFLLELLYTLSFIPVLANDDMSLLCIGV